MALTSRREENAEATRTALLAAARRAFAANGFSSADVGAIAAEARVTTGAIYHHFGSKKGLFQAVAEAIEMEILTKAETGAGELSWRFLTTAFARLIDLCAAPDIQRIIFAEGPQVLGPEAWRALEGRYAIGAVTGVLTYLMSEGVVRRGPDRAGGAPDGGDPARSLGGGGAHRRRSGRARRGGAADGGVFGDAAGALGAVNAPQRPPRRSRRRPRGSCRSWRRRRSRRSCRR